MLPREITLLQAYARGGNLDANQATKDWLDGKDFKIMGGPYCSSGDRFQMFKDGITKIFVIDKNCKVLFVVDLAQEAKTAEQYE